MYRIYRDTRFSDEQDAAQDPRRGRVSRAAAWRRHQGARPLLRGRAEWVWVGGGMYAPDTSQLHAVREHIAANIQRLRAIVESPGSAERVGQLEGEQLQRVPRGFPKDHPAAEYLRHRQFLAGTEFPGRVRHAVRGFTPASWGVPAGRSARRFLNEPLLASASDSASRSEVRL